MMEPFTSLRKQVLKKESIDTGKRFVIARTVLLSRGLYQCAAWPSLNASEYASVHSAVMRVYRSVDGSDVPDSRLSDDALLAKNGLAAPRNLLTAARLLLFFKVVVHAPMILLVVLAHASPARRSWLSSVKNDLAWLAAYGQNLQHMADASIADWVAACKGDAKRIRINVHTAMVSREANQREAWATTKKLQAVGVAVSCETCGKQFPSRQKCAVHAYRDHGSLRTVRDRIGSTVCPCCLQDFRTRERALNHLAEKSDRCRAMVLATQPILEADAVAQLNEAEAERLRGLRKKGWRRSYAQQPVARVPGPLTEIAYGLGLSHKGLLRTGFHLWD